MAIRIRARGINDLGIETSYGNARVCILGNELRVEHEEVLKEIGLSLSDALALFFDQAAAPATRERYPMYLSRKGGGGRAGIG